MGAVAFGHTMHNILLHGISGKTQHREPNCIDGTVTPSTAGRTVWQETGLTFWGQAWAKTTNSDRFYASVLEKQGGEILDVMDCSAMRRILSRQFLSVVTTKKNHILQSPASINHVRNPALPLRNISTDVYTEPKVQSTGIQNILVLLRCSSSIVLNITYLQVKTCTHKSNFYTRC